jgi:hypothetical protein
MSHPSSTACGSGKRTSGRRSSSIVESQTGRAKPGPQRERGLDLAQRLGDRELGEVPGAEGDALQEVAADWQGSLAADGRRGISGTRPAPWRSSPTGLPHCQLGTSHAGLAMSWLVSVGSAVTAGDRHASLITARSGTRAVRAAVPDRDCDAGPNAWEASSSALVCCGSQEDPDLLAGPIGLFYGLRASTP